MAVASHVLSSAWTKVGNNVSAITVCNDSGGGVYLMATSADAAPGATTVGIPLRPGQALASDDLSEFRVASAAYVWARAIGSRANVIVLA